MTPPKPTSAELSILQVLWETGPTTVRAVHEVLNEQHETGYTTVLKLMQIMHKKGLVHRDSSSKAHVYAASITEKATQTTLIQELLDGAFQGSAQRLVLSALSSQPSTPEELAEIRQLIDELERKSK